MELVLNRHNHNDAITLLNTFLLYITHYRSLISLKFTNQVLRLHKFSRIFVAQMQKKYHRTLLWPLPLLKRYGSAALFNNGVARPASNSS